MHLLPLLPMNTTISDSRPITPRRVAIWFVSLLCPTLLFATQNYVTLLGTEREMSWWFWLWRESLVWAIWGAVSPWVFAFTRRFPVSGKHWLRNLLFHLPVGALFAAATLALFVLASQATGISLAPAEMTLWERLELGFTRSFAFAISIYGVAVTAYHALWHYRQARQRELRAWQLERNLVAARLEALRNQLHPHFLFNTLHMISALMSQDVPAARRMIARLSDLLRRTLDSSETQETSVADEIEFLEGYLEIQRARFHDRLTIELRIPSQLHEYLVPRLILQPIVENAIRHGTAAQATAGIITIAAEQQGAQLLLTVCDNGPGIAAGKDPQEGIGLANTRERLQQLYGQQGTLTLANRPEGGACATIVIPILAENRG